MKMNDSKLYRNFQRGIYTFGCMYLAPLRVFSTKTVRVAKYMLPGQVYFYTFFNYIYLLDLFIAFKALKMVRLSCISLLIHNYKY